MTCPTCKVEMMIKDDHYYCPICDGEYFPAEYFKQREDPGYMAAWAWSMLKYYAAMRDGKETARVSRKVAKLAGI